MTNIHTNTSSVAKQETDICHLEKLSSNAKVVMDAAYQRLYRRVRGKSISSRRNKEKLRIRLPGDSKFSLHRVVTNSFCFFENLASFGGTGFIFSTYRSGETAQVLTLTILKTGRVIIC